MLLHLLSLDTLAVHTATWFLSMLDYQSLCRMVDIISYQGQLGQQAIRVLDFESDNSSSSSSSNYHSNSSTNINVDNNDNERLVMAVRQAHAELSEQQVQQVCRSRMQCVAKAMPTLAYVLSDVIMCVSTEPWSSVVYFQQLQRLYNMASSSIRSAGKPFVLLIRCCTDGSDNGSSTIDTGSVDMNAHTLDFMRRNGIDFTNQQDSWISLFSGIQCITLPAAQSDAYHQHLCDLKVSKGTQTHIIQSSSSLDPSFIQS
jgi:hypothetical protein